MSLYKRNKTWWTDFSVDGERYRLPLDTSDWREAQSKEKKRIAEAQAGKLARASREFSRLGFSEAVARYLDGRKLEVSARTVEKESDLLAAPKKYFRDTPLRRLTVDSLRSYLERRAADGRAAVYVNMEMGAMRRVLKRAKRWHLFADELRPLPKDGRQHQARAMSPEEKARLLRIAASRPDWQVARIAMVLALNTTMRGCEIRGLRWKDVDFIDRTLTIRKSKTEAGVRVIPLNPGAWAAIMEARDHILQVFDKTPDPDWFVLPHEYERNGSRNPDPIRPVTSWRKAWRALTQAVECPSCGKLQPPADACTKCEAAIRGIKSPLAGFRFHDLRHHAITELAESQASDQTIKGIAGHVSQRMLEHYSHVRLEAKRRALEALSTPVGSPVTSQPTSQAPNFRANAPAN